jgi:cardiolipin synthase
VKNLRQSGIKVVSFNKVRASVDLILNNRDHRKICVIDGYVSMTGGINLADEYINETHELGHWMDSAVILKGAATTSFVVAFCEMWSSVSRESLDVERYIVKTFPKCKGYVQPYADNPLDTSHHPGEGIYRQILGSAKDYVYIITPYLILDNTMITAITSAAKAGVDVRIITPKVGDKWYVHPVTQFNYQELLEAGVRIFEYTPGFVHSKLFVSDDAVATCGTVNMDYRSYYFHFECGVWTCSTDAVLDIKNDFFKIQHVSQEITLKKWAKRPIRKRFFQALLNVFAPFM